MLGLTKGGFPYSTLRSLAAKGNKLHSFLKFQISKSTWNNAWRPNSNKFYNYNFIALFLPNENNMKVIHENQANR